MDPNTDPMASWEAMIHVARCKSHRTAAALTTGKGNRVSHGIV